MSRIWLVVALGAVLRLWVESKYGEKGECWEIALGLLAISHHSRVARNLKMKMRLGPK